MQHMNWNDNIRSISMSVWKIHSIFVILVIVLIRSNWFYEFVILFIVFIVSNWCWIYSLSSPSFRSKIVGSLRFDTFDDRLSTILAFFWLRLIPFSLLICLDLAFSQSSSWSASKSVVFVLLVERLR